AVLAADGDGRLAAELGEGVESRPPATAEDDAEHLGHRTGLVRVRAAGCGRGGPAAHPNTAGGAGEPGVMKKPCRQVDFSVSPPGERREPGARPRPARRPRPAAKQGRAPTSPPPDRPPTRPVPSPPPAPRHTP